MKKPSRCVKKGVRKKKRGRAIEKTSEVGPKTRKDDKKVGFSGQKTRAYHQEIARTRT